MMKNDGMNLWRRLRQRSTRKFFLLINLLILSAFSLLAGCQLQDLLIMDNSGQTAVAVSPTSTNQPWPDVTTTPESTAEKTVLTIWLPLQLDPENGSTAGNLLKQRLADFEAEHPQFALEVRIKEVDGQGGLLDSLITTSAAAPAALPAIVALPSRLMQSAASGELLQALADESVNLGDPDWLPYADDIARHDSQFYGFPFGGDALVLAYHPLLTPVPPTTWQELILKKESASFPAADTDAVMAMQLYLSAGGSLTDETGQAVLTAVPLQQTLDILNNGAQNDVFPYWLANFSSFDQSWNAFLNQQTTYAVIWSSQYLQNLPDNVSIAAIPRVADESTTLVEGWSWCIPSLSTAEKQNSLMLAQYLSEPDFINRWAQAAGYLPVRESGLESWRNQLNSQLVMEIVAQDEFIPITTSDGVTAPLMKDATVQLVKKQTGVQQLLDAIIGKFQVQ